MKIIFFDTNKELCKKNSNSDCIYVAFEFNPKNAIVPDNTDGKFRVSKSKCIGEVENQPK